MISYTFKLTGSDVLENVIEPLRRIFLSCRLNRLLEGNEASVAVGCWLFTAGLKALAPPLSIVDIAIISYSLFSRRLLLDDLSQSV